MVSRNSAKEYINGKEESRVLIDVEFNLSITEVASNEKGGEVTIKVIGAGVNSKKREREPQHGEILYSCSILLIANFTLFDI